MKYTATQILVCTLSSTYWLSSCGMLFDYFTSYMACMTVIIAAPLASLLSVVLIGLCAPNYQRHMALGLSIWLLSTLFIYSFSF